MPRPTRVHVEGALYYISCRAIEKTALFKDQADYEAYLELLESYRSQFGFKLFAYALLSDQLHLCLELTNETTISTVMHAINSRYTKYYGKRYGHTGHLFQERFKLTLVEKAPNLVRLTGYLHTYARRSGAIAGALEPYPWTSYSSYLAAGVSHSHPPIGGEVQEVCDRLAEEHPGTSYEAWLASIPEEVWEQWQQELSRPVVGSEAFRQRVAQQRTMSKSPATAIRQTDSGPMPQPKPSGPHRGVPAVVTASLSIGFLALCTAGFYAKNVTSLKQTLGTLVRERSLQSLYVQNAQTLPQEANPAATAQLATFIQPSRLNGTSWDVQVHTMTGIAQPDRIEFRNGKVVSQQLSTQGFLPSNYTLSVQRNGVVVWETMQTAPSGEIVCWRGEWDGSRMQGVVTRQLPGTTPSNFSFVGIPQTQPELSHQTSET